MLGQLLTDQELDLLIELLENDSQRLSVTIRRTDAHKMHDELRNRQRTIDRLIEQFREVRAGLPKAGE